MNRAHPTDTVVDRCWEGKSVGYVIRSDHWDEFRVELWNDGDLDNTKTSHHSTLVEATNAMLALIP